MDRHGLGRALEEFATTYQTHTTRNPTLNVAARWWRLSLTCPDLTAPIAASWDRSGYLPEEAEPLIRDGITPARAREMEHHAQRAAGGREQLAAQRVREMAEMGEVIDPARLIRVQDPTDPTREIIAVRPDEL